MHAHTVAEAEGRDAGFHLPTQGALAHQVAGEVHAAIPQARLLAYERVGHALHWEEPERFAADLAGFVAGLRR